MHRLIFIVIFFYRPIFRKTDIRVLALEVREAFPQFIAGIAKRAPKLSSSLENLQDVYRQIFYIEMLCRLRKREMTDTRLNIRDIMSRYFEVFSCYEELLGIITVPYKN